MRLAEFGDNDYAVTVAADLSQALFRYRADTAIRRIAEAADHNVEDIGERAIEEARRPLQGLDTVYGAGLVWVEDRTQAVVLLDATNLDTYVVDHDAAPGFPTRLNYRSEIGNLIEDLLGGTPDVWAIPITEPQPQFATVETVTGPSRTGTFGVVVHPRSPGTWAQDLITTAGHVAPSSGQAVVHDSQRNQGNVVWSQDPACASAPTPCVDFALIDPKNAGITATSAVNLGRSAPSQQVEVRGAVTKVGTSYTMGFTPALYVPSVTGMWAQTYFTGTQCSRKGDSGAPVFEPGTNTVVGHVVGASPPMMSFIQDIDTQLRATNCKL
ncbi:hypothetical protein ACFRAQ_07300 [Nocardia sp. NPDC056611]|uniref:hypothetical protein n=1 Tax=Nocardia sp. NPDC056611 TaxID=3345877 RepID=UPI00366C61CD